MTTNYDADCFTHKQGSDEWKAAKLGKVGASRVADIVARTKTGFSTSRANYQTELLLERLTGNFTEGYVSVAMQQGTEREPKARTLYEYMHDVDVEQVGFIPHPRIRNAGASPDGYVGKDGLVEIKCPLSATHWETLKTEKVPERYFTQMQWQLACTQRKHVDYVSYDPAFPEKMQLIVIPVERAQIVIDHLEKEVTAFLKELDLMVEDSVRKFGVLPKVLAA